MEPAYGERSMAAAVILRAVEDATAEIKSPRLVYDRKSRSHKSIPQGDVTQKDKDDAFAFLTSMSRGWRESRRLWCIVADMDPDKIRRMVMDDTILPIRRK